MVIQSSRVASQSSRRLSHRNAAPEISAPDRDEDNDQRKNSKTAGAKESKVIPHRHSQSGAHSRVEMAIAEIEVYQPQ
jgi:hypothetical protein